MRNWLAACSSEALRQLTRPLVILWFAVVVGVLALSGVELAQKAVIDGVLVLGGAWFGERSALKKPGESA